MKKHDILKVPKYYDIVRKFHGNMFQVQASDIANIIVFQKRMIEINTAMQKMKNLKIFLCTQGGCRYRGLIFYVC